MIVLEWTKSRTDKEEDLFQLKKVRKKERKNKTKRKKFSWLAYLFPNNVTMDAEEKFNSINFAGEKLTKKNVFYKSREETNHNFQKIQNMKF